MPDLTPLPPLRDPRTFTGRSDYRRQLKSYQGRAVRAAREENGGNITADEARTIRDRVFAKFVAAHGTVEDVPALDSNAQGRSSTPGRPVLAILTPEQHAQYLREEYTREGRPVQETRPLVVSGTPLKVRSPRLPGDLAPRPAAAPAPAADAPAQANDDEATPQASRNGVLLAVQCASNNCARWVQAKGRKPQRRYCRSHDPRRRLVAPVALAEATA